MEKDCNRARAKYISKSLDIRQTLSFASPEVIMKGVQVFASDLYGCMLWDLSSNAAESLFKSWNTNIKLIYDIPRNTFTYLIEGHFSRNFLSLRNQVYLRYAGFFQGLRNSQSEEVRFLSMIVSKDPRSNTFRNLKLLRSKTELDEPYMYGPERLKLVLSNMTVPNNEKWRLGLLDNLLTIRKEKQQDLLSTDRISEMISGLCNT